MVPHKPDWSETSRFLAYTLSKPEGGGGLYIGFNTSHLPQVGVCRGPCLRQEGGRQGCGGAVAIAGVDFQRGAATAGLRSNDSWRPSN